MENKTPHQLVLNQSTKVVTNYINDLANIIQEEQKEGRNEIYWLCTLAFQYGYICSKRESRRKKGKLKQ